MKQEDLAFLREFVKGLHGVPGIRCTGLDAWKQKRLAELLDEYLLTPVKPHAVLHEEKGGYPCAAWCDECKSYYPIDVTDYTNMREIVDDDGRKLISECPDCEKPADPRLG